MKAILNNQWLHLFTMFIGAVCILPLCILQPSVAVAQPYSGSPTPKVFVVDGVGVGNDVSAIIPQRISSTMTQQLQGENNVELLPSLAEIIRRKSGGQHAGSAIAQAEQSYTSGIGLLNAGESQRAADALSRAVELMEQNLSHLHNFNSLKDAYANLAIAYFNAGFDLDARRSIQRYAHLHPDAKLDRERFPRALIGLYQDEVSRVKKASTGIVAVTSDIQGALVYLDGELKGETPLVIEDATFGYHYLVVRDTGSGRAQAQEIRVRGRGQTEAYVIEFSGQQSNPSVSAQSRQQEPSFYLSLRDRLKSGNYSVDELSPFMAELARQTATQYVAWITVLREGHDFVAIPFVYRMQDNVLVRLTESTFNRDLSNVRMGGSQIAQVIVASIGEFPRERAIQSVKLVENVSPVATGEQNEQRPDTPANMAGNEAPYALSPPPHLNDSERSSNRWKYAAWGGAAVVVGGLIAGSLYLLSNSDNPQAGFGTEVSW